MATCATDAGMAPLDMAKPGPLSPSSWRRTPTSREIEREIKLHQIQQGPINPYQLRNNAPLNECWEPKIETDYTFLQQLQFSEFVWLGPKIAARSLPTLSSESGDSDPFSTCSVVRPPAFELVTEHHRPITGAVGRPSTSWISKFLLRTWLIHTWNVKKKRLVYVQMTSYTLIRVTIFTSLSDKKQHIWFLYRSKESQTSAALARVKPTPTRNDTTWTTGQIDVVVTWNIKKTTFSRHRKLGFIVNYWFTPVHSLDVPTLNLSLANSLSRGEKKSKSCLPHDKNRRLLNLGEFAIQLQKDDIYIQIVKTSFEK